MRSVKTVCALLGLMLAGCVVPAWAGSAPPSPLVSTDGAPRVNKVFAQTFALGDYKAQVGVTRLSDLKQTFGGTLETLPGQLAWLCYDTPGSRQRVWFSSEDSHNGRVDTVTLAPATGAACPVLPSDHTPVIIDQGVRLGMSRADLLQRLGAPSREAHGWVIYAADQTQNKAKQTLGLVVRFENDKAVYIAASRNATGG